MGCCDCRLSFSEILKILKFHLPRCVLGTLFLAILPSLPAALYAGFAVWTVWAGRWEEGWQRREGGSPGVAGPELRLWNILFFSEANRISAASFSKKENKVQRRKVGYVLS